jgi:hypothetical protein
VPFLLGVAVDGTKAEPGAVARQAFGGGDLPAYFELAAPTQFEFSCGFCIHESFAAPLRPGQVQPLCAAESTGRWPSWRRARRTVLVRIRNQQDLESAIRRSGGKQSALDEMEALRQKLDFLQQTGRYDRLLNQLRKSNDKNNFLALVLEANFAHQFESQNLPLTYEVKQEVQHKSSIDFLRNAPSGDSVYFELRLLQEAQSIGPSSQREAVSPLAERPPDSAGERGTFRAGAGRGPERAPAAETTACGHAEHLGDYAGATLYGWSSLEDALDLLRLPHFP